MLSWELRFRAIPQFPPRARILLGLSSASLEAEKAGLGGHMLSLVMIPSPGSKMLQMPVFKHELLKLL